MDTPVIDFHAHVGRWGTLDVDDDPVKYLRIMDAAGVDRTFVSCICYGDARRNNDLVAAFVARNPDRFGGFAFVTPHYPEEAVPELERAFDRLGMKALKVYPPYFDHPITHQSWYPIFEWCNDRGIPVKSHTSYNWGTSEEDVNCRPRLFIDLAERFPRVRWILAHAGNMEPGRIEAVEAARTCPNIFLETCTSYGEHGTIEFLVEGAGADRVLFGSDMPLMDARFQIGRIVTADISDEAKRKVLGLNALRVLGLEG